MLGEEVRRRGLAVRIVLLLSLALLPLGAISVWQTAENARQSERASELALLLLTERAANDLQAVIQRAYGVTRALGQTVAATEGTPACDAAMSRFVSQFPVYSLAAFVTVDGAVTCASNGSRFAFTDPAQLDALRLRAEQPGPEVAFNPVGAITDVPVVLISDAVFDEDTELIGFLSLSVPAVRLLPSPTAIGATEDLSVVTFNQRGEILTATDAADAVDPLLPADRSLRDLVGPDAAVFTTEDRVGDRRIYGFVPLVSGVAYALSSWPLQSRFGPDLPGTIAAASLPLMMWLASLVIVFIAIGRMAIRPIRALSRRMRLFAGNRRLSEHSVLGPAAAEELHRIEADFQDMARSILQDDATLENNLREKNILLKEVHHRVKNNLQLVSSIMNMQIRRTPSDETKGTLRRLQDRVMGMAAVHRALYKSDDFTRINGSILLGELSQQLLEGVDSGIRVRRSLGDVVLVPEQAVPLSMLASEAITNAVKHIDPKGGDHRAIEIELFAPKEGHAHFSVTSTGAADENGGSGLGMQLIRAFEAQLEGTLSVTNGDGRHRVAIDFPLWNGSHASRDY
jgi:two-component sensor histidine kinase